jgi:uncharacterized membrane protein YedE/YeeE
MFMITGVLVSSLRNLVNPVLVYSKFFADPRLKLNPSVAALSTIALGVALMGNALICNRPLGTSSLSQETATTPFISADALNKPNYTAMASAPTKHTSADLPMKHAQLTSSAPDSFQSLVASAICGTIFAIGLIMSRMCNPSKVVAFLDPLSPLGWDPSLGLTMGSALSVALIGFHLLPGTPSLRPEYELPNVNAPVTASLIAGSAIFGVGWGMMGLCPGPSVMAIASGSPAIASFIVAMVVGMKLTQRASVSSLR